MSEQIILPRKRKTKPFKIGVIVQARMTSKRFPGKMMHLLMGKTLVERVLERVKLIKGAEPVLAVPDDDASEPMLMIAERMGVPNFCGPELDVLRRYYDAARFFEFDVIMRITGDCPFIDPIVCREVIDLLLWRKQDYTSNIFPTRTYPQGLDCEAFTMDCLDAANLVAHTPYEREHVTPWMQQTAGIKRAQIQQRLDQSHKNWCVDVPEDIERLETLYKDKKAGNEKLN